MKKLLLAVLLILLFPCFRGTAANDFPEKIFSHEFKTKEGERVWIYLPPNAAPGAKIPCVLVPPAGSRLYHGMNMGEGDRPEHLPYARAGFAVVCFDISGPWPEEGDFSARRKATAAFLQSNRGVNNALDALQIALDQYPQIDPNRVYIAGHSSAGTLALQVAASTDKIKGCAVFAPVADLAEWLKKEAVELDLMAPGFFISNRTMSPLNANSIDSIHCPVFLFSAKDDTVVPAASVIAYKDALLAHQKSVELVIVETGGHYDSMIRPGISLAIDWLKKLDQKNKAE